MMLLSVPRQDAIPGVDTRTATLRAALDTLPYADAVGATQQVLERLRDINHQILPGGHRYELMQAFSEAYARLHEGLRAGTAEGGPVVEQRHRLLAEFTEQLLNGYKYIINSSQDEKQRWGKPKHLVGAINYSAHLILLLLAARYQEYLPTDERLWHEAIQISQFAADTGYPASPAADFPFAPEGRLNATGSMTLAALLRLADPYHLPPNAIWELLQYLCGHMTEISQRSEAPEGEAVAGVLPLCISCDSDRAVRHQGKLHGEIAIALDVVELLHSIQEDIGRLDASLPPARIGFSRNLGRRDAVQLLNHLLKQYRLPPERRLVRVDAHEETIEIGIGLETAFTLHNGGVPFNPMEYIDLQDEEEIDIGYPLETLSACYRSKPKQIRCSCLNRSAGGMALHQAAGAEFPLKVGQLVVLPSGKNGGWLTGAVRWVVNHGDEGREAGIQYVARDARPAAVRPLTGDVETRFLPALTLRLQQGESIYRILFGTRGLFHKDRLLELEENDERRQIRCIRLLESNTNFERFIYEPVDEAPADQQ
ncbi:MAG TPA: hypothetical protein ENJ05_08175 [Thiotrichales bacterium]|nr:hypothetical protein [Thiotrichales bacterium]